MNLSEFALRVGVAFVLGSIVGFERQYRQRMAGLRTNALVATGTSFFVMITPLVGGGANPTQIVAYVVSGIGFLAGGVIFKERLSVSGLNTAATLWCTAAIGALVGIGALKEAGVGVVAILAANILLRPIAQQINRQPMDASEIPASYEVRVEAREEAEVHVRTALIAAIRSNNLTLHAVYSDDIDGRDRVEVIADVVLTGNPDARLEKIVTRVGVEPGVVGVSWKAVPIDADETALVPEA